MHGFDTSLFFIVLAVDLVLLLAAAGLVAGIVGVIWLGSAKLLPGWLFAWFCLGAAIWLVVLVRVGWVHFFGHH